MTIRLEMLEAARRAPAQLGDSAAIVASFIESQLNAAGGFNNRAGVADLYYSAFGLQAMEALQLPVPPVENYLLSFGAGKKLGLVDLCSLARCWACSGCWSASCFLELRQGILSRIEDFRTTDGGYHSARGHRGSVYAAFLAMGAYQDLQAELPMPNLLLQSVNRLRIAESGWANDPAGMSEPGVQAGSTNVTAAALTILRHLAVAAPHDGCDWLLRQAHPQGGFVAAPGVPVPDLLSTATALHALACSGVDVSPFRDRCLDFLDSLWTNRGGFHGNWTDDTVDCEYTYYGLLALGHLTGVA